MAGLLDFPELLRGLLGGQAPPSPQPQYQAPPQQQPQNLFPGTNNPSTAAIQNFAASPTILGGISNAYQGATTGQRTDPVGMYQQNSQMLYGLLRQRGLPHADAALAATDPEAFKQIAPNYFEPPKLVKTGTDPFTGQDTFNWAQPNKMQLTPATTTAAPGTTPTSTAPGVSMQSFSDALQKGVSGPDLYNYLPKGMAASVKSMIEGRTPPPSSFALRSPMVQGMIQAANAIDPNFDQTAWSVRNATAKNYLGGGKQFQELQAIGTVAGHLDTLKQAADALDNTRFPRWNSIANLIKQGSGDPSVDRFNTAMQAVSNELSKAYRGGHVTEGDVKDWQSNINAAKSPDQLKAVIGTLNDLLASKRQRLEEGYAQSMSGDVPLPKEFSAASDKAQKTFNNIAAWSQGATAPSGAATASNPSSTAPTVIPEGATATHPNGQRLIRQNGKWVPFT